MCPPDTFQNDSYQQHAEHFKQYAQDGEKSRHAKAWFDEGSVDAWRHHRLYRVVDPLVDSLPKGKWLTVGDGRYGKDAKYLLDKGGHALATDISSYLLKEAKEMGFIADYKVENAEALSFADGAFDYVFCKESYHHFPRPMVALYEMLRVAGQGVVLIEPNDLTINRRPLHRLLKCIRPDNPQTGAYEESGNFIYSISRREMVKVAMGLNFKAIAFRGMNDVYAPGVEFEQMADNGPLQKKLRRKLFLKDLLCRLGLLDFGLLTAVIFKKNPSAELRKSLADEGYDVVMLPENPYIAKPAGDHS